MNDRSSTNNLKDQIYEEVLSRIQLGEVGSEQRLIDTALAAKYGVSRMPVREALLRLVHEGYLVQTTRGYMLPQLSQKQVLEVFELRRLLEPRAAGLAAHAISDCELQALESAFDAASATLKSGDIGMFFKASTLFRDGWINAVPNMELRNMIHRYLAQIQAVRLVTLSDPEAHQIVVAGQKEMLIAFQERNGIAAQDAMLRFVLAGQEKYLELA